MNICLAVIYIRSVSTCIIIRLKLTKKGAFPGNFIKASAVIFFSYYAANLCKRSCLFIHRNER